MNIFHDNNIEFGCETNNMRNFQARIAPYLHLVLFSYQSKNLFHAKSVGQNNIY